MPSHTPFRRPSYAVSSVDHALRLLQLLRDEGVIRLSVAAAEIGLAPSTAHRLLAMLVYRGFATRTDNGGYAPGPALSAPPGDAPWARAVRRVCRPHLESLSHRLDETVTLLYRVGTTTRYLDTVESSKPLRVGDRTGVVLDAREASGGKALLAVCSDDELERMYLSGSEATPPADRAAFSRLLRELQSVRTQGYAINREQTEKGVFSVGMSLRARDGAPIAAFSRLLRELQSVRTQGYAINREQTEKGVFSVGMSLRARDGAPIAAFAVAMPLTRAEAVDLPALISDCRMARTALEQELASVSVTAMLERAHVA